MKKIAILIFTFCCFQLTTMAQDSTFIRPNDSKHADFTTVIDIAKATKDGIYLKGYVVNISYEELEKLNGKTVRITGKVKTVKGIGTKPNGEWVQGRVGDSYHIFKPTVKVI